MKLLNFFGFLGKSVIVPLLIAVLIGSSVAPLDVFAVYVNGYYRSNGTYVNGYERTAPDGNPYNNYSYPGNYNPNTGTVTGGNPDTYLNNYYKNSSGSTYTPSPAYYPTTPSCPINSYYDGVSSCKCSFGYAVSGSSCVSLDSMCQDQLGYSSSYDSLSSSCKCSYGYVIGDYGQCTSASQWCSSKIGIMSQYNNSSKKCECMSGYEYNGTKCEYKSHSSYTPTYTDSATTCPANALAIGTDCYCKSGYLASGSICISEPVKQVVPSDPVIDPTVVCTQRLGIHGIVAGQNSCGCAQGYSLNETKTSCLENKVIITPKVNNSIISPTSPSATKPVTKTPKVITEVKKTVKTKTVGSATSTPKSVATSSSSTIKTEPKNQGSWFTMLFK